MKKVKDKIGDEKHLNNVLLNILFISLTFFIAIGSGVYFLGKLDNKIDTNENSIKIIKSDIETFKNNENTKIIEINKLNNKLLDNKMYIYQKYKNSDERNTLIRMLDDDYSHDIEDVLNKKTTK